ncbi:MAG: GAF domain-containing protein [Gammaproteobacteria bacterium]|nr:GAF domain-containing protein [Gammaproteobacteria bacterium]
MIAVTGKSRDELLGESIWKVFPDLIGTAFERDLRDAVAKQKPATFEFFYPSWSRWFEIHAYPSATGVVLLIADITERKRAELEFAALSKHLAADLADMQRLHEISICLVRQDDSRALFEQILDASIAIMGADLGNLKMYDLLSGHLRITTHRGFDQAFVDYFASVPMQRTSCGMALYRGERIIIDDLTRSPISLDPELLELMLRVGARAMQSTPLRSRSGKLLGVLSTHFRVPHRPDDRQLRLLDLLARQAADLIERTQVEEALQQAHRRKDDFWQRWRTSCVIRSRRSAIRCMSCA